MSGEQVVALALLRPASGRPITGDSIITTDTLADYAPAPEDAQAVARALADAGFETGPVVGVALSLAGPRALFERFFGVAVEDAEGGGWLAVSPAAESGTREVPLDRVADALRARLAAVTFEEPAERGGEEAAP